MTTSEKGMTPAKAKALREQFPAAAIGKLPKPYQRDAKKGNCHECGGYHGLPAAHLDYVGHAATTDRLLAVDPEWTWEPMAVTEAGLPCLDNGGNLWIRLTVCGVTRIGVGDGKSAKECIGDAIRNAAMRFGVALDLWAKEDLHEIAQARGEAVPEQPPTQPQPPAQPAKPAETGELMNDKTRARLFAMLSERGITDRDEQIRGMVGVIGRQIESRSELTEAEAQQIIASLRGAA